MCASCAPDLHGAAVAVVGPDPIADLAAGLDHEMKCAACLTGTPLGSLSFGLDHCGAFLRCPRCGHRGRQGDRYRASWRYRVNPLWTGEENRVLYDLDYMARDAYEAYGDNAGWRNVYGQPMPPWSELTEDTRGHWRAAAAQLLGKVAADA